VTDKRNIPARRGRKPSRNGDGHHAGHAPGRANLTDVGNGKRLAARHGADLRHCHPWRKWVSWDGRRWMPDATATATSRGKETVASLAQWAARQVISITKQLKEVSDGQE
jgi:putative DNA primase/helicase